ncbi:sporulation histidine kinase inhibitor Sda [Radiobacillus kanasensis]|nr:sporulation histidine kinase inhibitor Sda [Radiobacillus kanasensis]UFU01344.1 sporulation histidine kinase inhibitor Sda [Radiobacillus kanasensis]
MLILSDQLLMTVYKEAVSLEMSQDFIELLKKEMERRGLMASTEK